MIDVGAVLGIGDLVLRLLLPVLPKTGAPGWIVRVIDLAIDLAVQVLDDDLDTDGDGVIII